MTPYLSLRSFLIALLVLLLLLLKLHVALVLLRAPSFEVYYLPVFYSKALYCISESLGALIYPHKEILASFKMLSSRSWKSMENFLVLQFFRGPV